MRSEPRTIKPKKTRGSRRAGIRPKAVRDADHEYFASNFPRLVRKHGGQWIVLVHGNLIGIDKKNRLASLIKKARSEYPDSIPFIAPIPTRDEIECVL